MGLYSHLTTEQLTAQRDSYLAALMRARVELSRWTYAGGKQLPGLVKRRAAERQLCEAGLA